MSPVATSKSAGLLEHPSEAFSYYQQQGVDTVVCEEKHMGSRVVMIACRDQTVSQTQFGVKDGGMGGCYTWTGRRFFDQPALEAALLTRLNQALSQTRFWQISSTDWVCLDCELMSWSAKAQGLLKQQ